MAKKIKRTKMSFSMSLFMAVGSIIGAGIFAKTTLVIRLIGNGVVIGFLLAAFYLFLKTWPEIVMSSALPVTGAGYMYMTRMVHPAFGFINAFSNIIIGTMNVGIMSLTFSTYFKNLFPNSNDKVVGIIIALLFTFLATFGIMIGGYIQDVCVVVLMGAILLYIVAGVPHVTIPLSHVLKPDATFHEMWALMGLLHGSLMGANVLMHAADEIENPGKNIPIIFISSTLICAILYGFMGFVSVGVIHLDEWRANWALTLADVAGRYMPPALVTFFIVGGPLLAVTTSITAMIIMFSRGNMVAARDGVLPMKLAQLNKYHAPVGAIWLNTIIAIVFILMGFELNDLMLITSIPGLLLSPIQYLAIFVLPKRYPKSYKNSFLGFVPHWLNVLIVIVVTVMGFTMGGSIITMMKPRNWITMIVYYGLGGVYAVWRVKYMKKKGIDMFARMKAPYQQWEEKEKAYAAAGK